MIRYVLVLVSILALSACGTLDEKTINISAGDTKQQVLDVMGTPQDRQLEKTQEAWQYCVSGAGFGYNDHKIIWFKDGHVTGITSYRSSRSGCTGAIRTVHWEEAPDVVVETRER